MHFTRWGVLTVAFLAAGFRLLPSPAFAATYTWTSPTAGGLWSDTTAWTPTSAAGGPTTADSVTLDTQTNSTSRTVTIDSTANSTVSTLTFNQTGSGTNELLINRAAGFTVTNALTLGASNGGVARVYVTSTGTAGLTAAFTGGVTLNAGGVLALGGFNLVGTSSNANAAMTGNVLIQGGLFSLDQYVRQGTQSGAAQNQITGNFTMTSGTFMIVNGTTGGASTDRRLLVQTSGTAGNVSITGGAMLATNAQAKLYMNGTANVFKPTTYDGNTWVALNGGNLAQSLDLATPSGTYATVTTRSGGIKTVSSTVSGTNIGTITIEDDNVNTGVGTTFKLGSNLTMASNGSLPQTSSLSKPDTSNRMDVGFDVGTYTLDLSAPTSGTFAPNSGVVVGTGTVTYWTFSGSGGKITARAFDFTKGANAVATSVGPGLTLEAKGGNSSANNLSLQSGTGAIDPTSIFRYSGTAAVGTPATLTGSNRAIGDVEVTSGALKLLTLQGLQNVRVTGGTLDLGSNALTVTSGSFGGGTVQTGTLTSGTFLATSGTVSASLAGTGGLTKTGAGTLALSGSNSYSGTTQINGGIVSVSSPSALSTGTITFGGGSLQYASGNAVDYSSRIFNSGSAVAIDMNGQTVTLASSLDSSNVGGFTRSGAGLLTLSGTSTSLPFQFVFNGGTTVIDPGGNGSFSTTGKFYVGNTSGTSTVTVASGSVLISPTTGYVNLADNNSGTATLNVTGGSATLGLASVRMMVGNKGAGTVNVSGGSVSVTGGNPIYIGGDQTYAQSNANGTLTISGGTMAITGAGSFYLGNSGSAGNTNTGIAGTLNLNGGELQTIRAITTGTNTTSTVNFNGGVLKPLASNATFLQGLTTANVQNGGARIDTNGYDITIGQNLVGSGTGGLAKSGSGTLTLSGSNTFTGDTTVSSGTVVLGNAEAIGQSVYDTASAGSLSFGSLAAASIGGLKGSGNINLANASSTAVALTVGGTATSSQYDGVLSGGAGLVKTGIGTLTLTGANTYSGGSTISGGTLQIGSGSTTGSISGTITNNGVLAFNRSNTASVSNTINGSGAVVHLGNGQLQLTGLNSYTGGTLLTGGSGSLLVTNASQVGSGTITLQTGGLGTQTTLSLQGVSLSNPIVYALAGSSRNNITVNAGSVTLGGPISITGTSSTSNILANNTNNVATISGSITAGSSFTGELSFRTGPWLLTGTVNFVGNAGINLNSGGTTTIQSTGNVWNYTSFSANNNTLRLGADNALPTGAVVSFSGTSTGGGLDLNGYSQAIPGFYTSSNGTAAARIFNNGSGTSTLTLSGLGVDRSSNVALADGAGGGKLALVMNSAGRRQTLSSATSSYTGGTRIVSGTIALGHANGLGGGGSLAVNGGGLDLAGYSPTVGALSGSSGGVITSGSTGAAVTLTISSVIDSTFGGLIQNGGGTVGLTKAGSGVLTLSAANTYTGLTNVNAGTLVVNGSLAGDVATLAGGVLGGSGSVGAIGGAGLVGPGNSPGILTATSIDPSSGLSFAFEFTQTAPNYGSATNSGNDLLWLTGGAPFTSSLSGSNTVSIYFTSAVVESGTLTGGFFTSNTGDFVANISGATFQYYVQDVGGSYVYNSNSYKSLAEYDPAKSVSISTVSANGGQVMQMVVVPEPGAFVLAGIGVAAVAWACRRRQAR